MKDRRTSDWTYPIKQITFNCEFGPEPCIIVLLQNKHKFTDAVKLAAGESPFPNFPNGNVYLFNSDYKVKKESNASKAEKWRKKTSVT